MFLSMSISLLFVCLINIKKQTVFSCFWTKSIHPKGCIHIKRDTNFIVCWFHKRRLYAWKILWVTTSPWLVCSFSHTLVRMLAWFSTPLLFLKQRLTLSQTKNLCDTQRRIMKARWGFIITSCLRGSSLQALPVRVIFNSSGSGDNITRSHANVTTKYSEKIWFGQMEWFICVYKQNKNKNQTYFPYLWLTVDLSH